MRSDELREKLHNAESKVEKTLKTIERHKAALEKKRALLSRCNSIIPFLDDLESIKFNEELRGIYKEETGEDLYWAICDAQDKEDALANANKRLEEQKQVVENWKQKLSKQTDIETMIAAEMPPVFSQLRDDLSTEWTEYDIKEREELRKKYTELGYREFIKQYKYSAYEALQDTDEVIKRKNEREAELWIVDLYNRVKEITGNVTDWAHIHYKGKALNGVVIGEQGTASVETIGAGGYNIQRYHLRVLVHKLRG